MWCHSRVGNNHARVTISNTRAARTYTHVITSRWDVVQVNTRHAPRVAKRRQPAIEWRYQPYLTLCACCSRVTVVCLFLCVSVCYHSYSLSVGFCLSVVSTRYLKGFWFVDFAKSRLFKNYGVVYIVPLRSAWPYMIHYGKPHPSIWLRLGDLWLCKRRWPLEFASSSFVSVHHWLNVASIVQASAS